MLSLFIFKRTPAAWLCDYGASSLELAAVRNARSRALSCLARGGGRALGILSSLLFLSAFFSQSLIFSSVIANCVTLFR